MAAFSNPLNPSAWREYERRSTQRAQQQINDLVGSNGSPVMYTETGTAPDVEYFSAYIEAAVARGGVVTVSEPFFQNVRHPRPAGQKHWVVELWRKKKDGGYYFWREEDIKEVVSILKMPEIASFFEYRCQSYNDMKSKPKYYET